MCIRDRIEARITYLAYAPEIAAVMLQRQQASAVVDARAMIVDGAVGMVKLALEKLSDDGKMCIRDRHATKDGVTYTIGYALNSSTILPEEISGMDSDQALEYIANKSMTFYTDRNATVIPDILFGRDYFVRVNGLTHVTPDLSLIHI